MKEAVAEHLYRKRRRIDLLKVVVQAYAGVDDKENTQKYLTMLLDEAEPEMKIEREKRLERMAEQLKAEEDKVFVATAQDRPRQGGLRKRKRKNATNP